MVTEQTCEEMTLFKNSCSTCSRQDPKKVVRFDSVFDNQPLGRRLADANVDQSLASYLGSHYPHGVTINEVITFLIRYLLVTILVIDPSPCMYFLGSKRS